MSIYKITGAGKDLFSRLKLKKTTYNDDKDQVDALEKACKENMIKYKIELGRDNIDFIDEAGNQLATIFKCQN